MTDKILNAPKKVSLRQQLKNQAATIQQLINKLELQRRFVNEKTKFTCEVDCPECKGKGQTTDREGLKLDFTECPACKGEGRLYFQGIGDFFVKSEFERKQAEDAAAEKEAEAKAQLAEQKKEKGEGGEPTKHRDDLPEGY